jgi:hypothetical protein
VLFFSFVGIDVAHLVGVIKQFPAFLFFENVAYALASLVLLIAFAKGKEPWCWSTLFGSYLAGRVSRSVVTPYGTFPKLAPQHVPLLALSAALALASLAGRLRGMRSSTAG